MFPVEQAPYASIDTLHGGYRSGELTAEALVETCLARVDRFDQRKPGINALTARNTRALEVARRLDDILRSGRFTGPLHGIPVLVKDQIETAGIETTFGSMAMRGYVPDRDATVVKRLRAAGAIVLAKTTMPDFAASWFSLSSRSGYTRCPWSLQRDAGGSSSGSAAGVAAGFAPVAIGEDTGGSVRIPAAYNNLVGLRVTTGLVSRSGIAPLVASQDTAGPITRTVADTATLLDVLVGFDPTDPATSVCRRRGVAVGGYRAALRPGALHGARMGLLTEALADGDDESTGPVSRVLGTALSTLEACGASVVPVSMADLADRLRETSLYLSRSRSDIDAFLSRRPVRLRDVASIVRQGLFDQSLDLLRAIAESEPDPGELPRREGAQHDLRARLVGLMETHALDALCFPTTPGIAPTPEELRMGEVQTQTFRTNTVIAAQSGLPAVTVPAGLTELGTPVGLELVGRPFGEHRLLDLAADFEAATPSPVVPPTTPC
ncbi:amidase [Geodermatophilus sp. DSM 45219]|uniref:amidase n=1 Tax=Geodermatophilus sp. DSM 45219 TaxID=1881103 RepID=UPI000891C7F6|nr:amidase [Geodermatophilus sp. DSM 45219]SDO15219.1 Asp-tRNAAsn/Glu-tRNAGln amidotransferase A subunit [Geodermatophilus sp. DSM 45219]